MKKVKNIIELDYFIVCQNFYSLIISLIIVLTKFTRRKEKSYSTESDHNLLILDINVPWNRNVKVDRTEIYNLRNIECQEKFLEYTNNFDLLTKSLINKDVRCGGKLWIKSLKFAIIQNFKKIRINIQRKDEKIAIFISC